MSEPNGETDKKESPEDEIERWRKMNEWLDKYRKSKEEKKRTAADLINTIKTVLIITSIVIIVVLLVWFLYRGYKTKEPKSLNEEIFDMIARA